MASVIVRPKAPRYFPLPTLPGKWVRVRVSKTGLFRLAFLCGRAIIRCHHQNFTCGGFSAPSLAVNSTIGLLLEKTVFAQMTVGNVRSAVL